MQRPAVVRGLARRALVPALACAAVLAAGIALAAGVSALRSEDSPPASSQPVELTATVGPTTHLFADELTGRVVVRVDRRVVDPNSVRVDATFRPYGVIEPPRVTTTTAGDLVTREYRYRVFCLRADCRPKGTERRRVVLAPVRVVLRRTDGGIRGTSLPLPPVEVATRLTPQDRLRPALDVGDEPLPAVTYRAEPDRAALVLGLAAGRARAARDRPARRARCAGPCSSRGSGGDGRRRGSSGRSDSSAGRSTTETSATGASRSTRSPRRSTRGTGRSRPRPATRPGRRAGRRPATCAGSRRRRSGRRGQRHDADPPRRGGHVRDGAAQDPAAATRARGGARRRRGGRARSRVGATAGEAVAPAAGDERGHRPRRLVEHRRPHPQADRAHARARGPHA